MNRIVRRTYVSSVFSAGMCTSTKIALANECNIICCAMLCMLHVPRLNRKSERVRRKSGASECDEKGTELERWTCSNTKMLRTIFVYVRVFDKCSYEPTVEWTRSKWRRNRTNQGERQMRKSSWVEWNIQITICLQANEWNSFRTRKWMSLSVPRTPFFHHPIRLPLFSRFASVAQIHGRCKRGERKQIKRKIVSG